MFWNALRVGGEVHVLPVEDLFDHAHTARCACLPRVEQLRRGDRLITHNSFDRRELLESAPNARLIRNVRDA